jgi:hypothetical protein
VDNTQRIVAAALFGSRREDLAHSLSLAADLVRSLASSSSKILDELQSEEDKPFNKASQQPTLTWSDSSPMQGFSLTNAHASLNTNNYKSYSSYMMKITSIFPPTPKQVI